MARNDPPASADEPGQGREAKASGQRRESTMEVELEEMVDEQGRPASQAPPPPPVPEDVAVTIPRGDAPRPPAAPKSSAAKPAAAPPRRSGPGETTMNGLLDELEADSRPPPPARPSRPPSGAGASKPPPPPPPSVRPPRRASGVSSSSSAGSVRPPRASQPPSPPRPSRPPSVRPSRPPSVPSNRPPPPPKPSRPPPRPSSPPQAGPPASEPDAFAQDARALIKACESELAGNPDAQRAARLHYEIARLYESPLRDLRRASAHYQEAYNRSPEHLPTIRGARRVLIARKSYQSALPLFDAEARITSDPARKAAIYYSKGRLLEDALGSKDEAKKSYATAHDLDRSDPAILKALEQCEIESRSWDALFRTYEREANAVSSDPRHRAALIVQRARLAEQRRGETDAAIELYETALKLDTRAAGAVAALKRLHHAQRRWRDLIRVLELEAQQSSDPVVRTMALYRIGRLHAERLGNRSEALGALERALAESPKDPLVLAELARLYESVERWEALAEVLQRLVETTREADERIGLLHRAGQLYEERLGNERGAVHFYEAALHIRPTYLPALQALGSLYARHESWEALVKMHLREAEATDENERRATAYSRVGELLEIHLGKPEEAAEHHKKALSQVPGYAPAFKALSRLLADAGKWRELVELYERAVDEAGDMDRAVTFLLKIGAIYEDDLHEPAQAAHAYRRVLDLDGNHLGAIHALQRATERAGRWQELVDALELEAEKTRDDKQIVALLHRAGEVLDERLGDRDGALSRFRKVLGIDPRHVPSLVSLGRIYYRMGRWEDLLDMYKRELELTPRGPDALALLQKMGELCEERIGREQEALDFYRRAIEMDPTHGPALRALSRMLRERGDWEELVRILELELNGLADPQARARASYRVGEVYEERLSKPDRALASYEKAIKAVPDYRPAVDALTRLRAERKAWTKLVDDLDREAANTADEGLAIGALMREGEIWAEQLDEPRRAIQAFEKVLEKNARHTGALMQLEPLYRRVGAWKELAQVYANLAETLGDRGARVAMLRELARLQETHSSSIEGDVRDTYEAILALLPDDPVALSSLERLALERGDRAMLVGVDTRLVAHTEDPLARAAYQTRLAESLEAGGGEGAIEAYRKALEADPESLGATRGLSRIAERKDDPVALAEAARREAAVASDGEVAARLLVRSATLRTERLDDQPGAQKDLERALEIWPDSAEAAERLGRMLLSLGKEGRLADLLARAAGSARNTDRVAALWMEVARIQADLLENVPGAISSLNRVLRSAPNHVATLRRLAELYERDGQWNESVNLLSRVVQLAPDREVLRDAHLMLAGIWDERLGETSRAMVSLQAVLALDANNREALARLSDVQERENKIQQAAETAVKLVEASADPRDKASALARLARIEQRRGNDQAAKAALRDAIALEGPGGAAAVELKTVTSTPGEWERYVEAVERFLARGQGGDMLPTPVFLELSRVRFDHLKQPNAAIETLQRGIDETGGDPQLRTELVARLRSVGRHGEAIKEIRRLLDHNLTRVESWRDLARTFEAMKRPAEARLALMPLLVLGAASKEEKGWLAQTPPRPARARAGSLDGEVLSLLLPRGEPAEAAAGLLTGLVEGLPKLYPPDLEAYGLSPRDRVQTKHGHPVRQLADQIAEILGVESFDLYIHRARGRGVALELTNPPSILVPSTVADLPEPQQVFLLGKPLVSIALRLHAVEKLTPRELEVLLASAARNVAAGYGAGLTSEEFLDDQAKRIYKALPRRSRKALDEIANTYVTTPRVDFPLWAEGILRMAQRVSAVLSDDLSGCVEVMRRTERDLQGLEGAALVRSAPQVADLLRFWVSETAMSVRKRAAMVPSGTVSSSES